MEATTKTGKVITGKFAALMVRIGAATPVVIPEVGVILDDKTPRHADQKTPKVEIPKIEIKKETEK